MGRLVEKIKIEAEGRHILLSFYYTHNAGASCRGSLLHTLLFVFLCWKSPKPLMEIDTVRGVFLREPLKSTPGSYQ